MGGCEVKMKVKWKDLSVPLKIAVVLSYIGGGVVGLNFLVGFIQGLLWGVI